MLSDLEHLIRLQQIDTATEQSRQRIEAIPSQLASLQDALEKSQATLVTVQDTLADNTRVRTNVENDLAAAQGQLSKFIDQKLAVKSNIELWAIQKEIATFEDKVSHAEDQILRLMLAADELTSTVREAEAALKAEEARTKKETSVCESEKVKLQTELQQNTDTRSTVASATESRALALFEHISHQRQGIAVVEARDGLCTYCNVRLRPQVFNDLRLNNALIQCDSCQRILYFQE